MKKYITLISLCFLMLCSCSEESSSEQKEYFSSKRALESSSQTASKEASSEEEKSWESFDSFFDSLDDDSTIKNNYTINSQVWEQSGLQGKLIESGQDTEPQRNLQLGKYRFGYNGCEVIAGYNMLTLLGENVDMPKLTAEFERNILVAQDGSFGSEPREMYLLLDAHGIPYETIKTIDECNAALDSGKALIFSYYTGTPYFSEIHTICITGGEKKYVLNRYNSVSGRSEIEGIADITNDNKNIIIAYAVKV